MTTTARHNSFNTRTTMALRDGDAAYFRLEALDKAGFSGINRLPASIKILLESLLRNENGYDVAAADIAAFAVYNPAAPGEITIPYKPARVLLQDFTGVPCVVDLAAMRGAMARLGGDPQRINPLIPVDLVIDHSVQMDTFATPSALANNTRLEYARNRERYEFLSWGQSAFANFSVTPPSSGICHQVNLEHLSTVVRAESDARGGGLLLFPDSAVGTDSHTPMVNGLSVAAWGVGGIEAEAVMLGQPLYMLAPEVIGMKVVGAPPPGTNATDLVLYVTQLLRRKGVVDKFVEFFGEGLDRLPVPDRATIANMSPECGSTMNFFPVDRQTLAYLAATNRGDLVDRVERYSKEQGLWRGPDTPTPDFKETMELDLSAVTPSMAGPSRPQDRAPLTAVAKSFTKALAAPVKERGFEVPPDRWTASATVRFPEGTTATIGHGVVALAAITSCTNTSNPSVLLGAGLLAKNAVERGLKTKPWVKTSLAPGSTVVTGYLTRSGLLPYLETLGFHVAGYGCATCIGNSGPLPRHVSAAIAEGDLVAAAVLSGNRNFEGRINPQVKASYLASPLLVVAYALAGRVDLDLTTEPLAHDQEGHPVYLKDIWPTDADIEALLPLAQDAELFASSYEAIAGGDALWRDIRPEGGAMYQWRPDSTYIQEPPFFTEMTAEPADPAPLRGARALVMVGDSITTDHISPAGAIPGDSPAAEYLRRHGVAEEDFNTFGSRRGNDRVMSRGTFANIRLRNQLAPGTEGGWTTHFPSGQRMFIFDAAQRYKAEGVPAIVLAGLDYGMGSSRDWAAKGPQLLGVRAVIARSYERIHRSNLVGMGILPLQFLPGQSAESLGLTGAEVFDIDTPASVTPNQEVVVAAGRDDGSVLTFTALCRLATPVEVDYWRNGGILPTVLRGFLKNAQG